MSAPAVARAGRVAPGLVITRPLHAMANFEYGNLERRIVGIPPVRLPTMPLTTRFVPVALALALTAGCGNQDPGSQAPASSTKSARTAQPAALPTGPVKGAVKGTSVLLDEGKWDGQLSLFEEESWGWSPSILLFFVEQDGSVENLDLRFDPATEVPFGVTQPHVHYRWRDPGTGEIQVESVTGGYTLHLTTDVIADGRLPGTIRLALDEAGIELEGAFEVVVED
jgi:hypothetical protein